MSHGLLRRAFVKVAAKRLSAVEANPNTSNQHEFNGSKPLKEMLGTEDRRNIPSMFVWLGDEQEGITGEGFLSWYDSRKNQPHRAAEYRLYFQSNAAMDLANAGDPVFLACRTDDTLMVIVTRAGSTMENQLLWLFDLPELPAPNASGQNSRFQASDIADKGTAEADFAIRYILDELGLEPEEPETDHLDMLLFRFGSKFPTAREFSALAREMLPHVSPLDDPDAALLSWLNQEEILFRRLERHIVADRLEKGFMLQESADVEGFLQFSLGVQNRRKARAGLALENHLEQIFLKAGVRYGRGVQTEGKKKPDFLFPGHAEYHNALFPAGRLTMLGAKSTCKDRWRQVLSEAARIEQKHLLTLEPGISENQTDEMQGDNLRLVLPAGLHDTYRPKQREWLMNLAGFMNMVQERQQLES
jgi:EcoRII C terminal